MTAENHGLFYKLFPLKVFGDGVRGKPFCFHPPSEAEIDKRVVGCASQPEQHQKEQSAADRPPDRDPPAVVFEPVVDFARQ